MAGRLLISEPSRVAMPLEARGQVLGGLVLTFATEQTFDEETRARLSSLAAQCAQALDRARLFDSERAANKAKDEFLAMLGHELRNPLMPIITSLELMKIRGDAFASERSIISRHVLRLNRLVDDLMDVSRIAGGKVELRRRRVELHESVVKPSKQRTSFSKMAVTTSRSLSPKPDCPSLLIPNDSLRCCRPF